MPLVAAAEAAFRTRLASRTPGATPAIERRPITVVFCDLVGSTGLSAEVDPEDLTDIIGAFQRTVTRAMNEFGGFVARYMGDGTLVYFGYPRANEDDAANAIRASLRAVEAVAALALPGGRRIQVHVGVATGLVVVGDIAGVGTMLGLDVAGATPNLAARLEGLAPPGSVYVAESTRKLAGSEFEWHDLGLLTLKGIPEPIRAFEVSGTRVLRGRFDAQHGERLAPMVGRADAWATLDRAWKAARRGRGGVVTVIGEPGIGKSRLVAELQHELASQPHALLRFFCSANRQDSPFYPVVRQIEGAAGFAREDSNDAKLDKLEALASKLSRQDIGLIADMLLVHSGDRYPRVEAAPQRKRARTADALLRLVERIGRDAPLLLVVEDAQWIDASTRELVDAFARRASGLAALCVVTARPEFETAWPLLPDATRIVLQPLGTADSQSIIARIAGDAPLPAEAVGEIVRRTDGIPLYVEEMTLAAIEGVADIHVQSATALSEPSVRRYVPMTLQASLLARLDRLGHVRDIVEVAAAIGRDFTEELLRAVVARPAEEVARALEDLVASGLCVKSAASTYGSGYSFRHMLIRDAAYNTMVREQRKSVHAAIATAIETSFADRAAANPEIVALHCTEGGLAGKAATYWLAAGYLAMRRSAMSEALAHLSRGLDNVRSLPDGDARRRCELDLTVALGKAQIATQGYAVDSTGETFARAKALCDAIGDSPQLLSVLHGLWTHALMRAELASAQRQSLDVLAKGEARGDPIWRLMGHRFTGVTHHPLGAFADARRYLERGIELYDPAAAARYAMITVDDPRVVMLTYRSWSLMCMGELDDARQSAAQAVGNARALGSAYTLAHALNGASFIDLTIDSPRAALARLDELMPLLEDHGIAYYGAVGILFRGWCLAALGERDEAKAMLDKGMESYRATGSRLYLSGFLRMAAEAHGRIGMDTVAFEQIHEAFQVMYATSQRWDQAEIHRVHAALLRATGDVDGAIAELRRGLAIAQAQGAGLWALRCAHDFALITAERGDRDGARNMLAPECARFVAQSAAPDVRASRDLLDALV